MAILWSDPRSEWKPLIPLLRKQLPQLLCLGDYVPEHRQGPALWLRCLVDRSLPAPAAAAGRVPVVYQLLDRARLLQRPLHHLPHQVIGEVKRRLDDRALSATNPACWFPG